MKFETRTLVLMAGAIVINIVVGQIVAWLKLPLFLDSIGTVLVGILAGPLAGAIVGTLANLIWGLILDPVAAAFFPVALVIGLVAGLCARYGLFANLWKTILSGVIICVISTIVATPIVVYMFGGVTGSGTDFATAYMLAMGSQLLQSVAISNLGLNVIDKVITRGRRLVDRRPLASQCNVEPALLRLFQTIGLEVQPKRQSGSGC